MMNLYYDAIIYSQMFIYHHILMNTYCVARRFFMQQFVNTCLYFIASFLNAVHQVLDTRINFSA